MDMLIDGGAHRDFSQIKTCSNNNTTKKHSEQNVEHDKTTNVHSSSSTTTPLMEQEQHSDYDNDDNITPKIVPSSPPLTPPLLGTTIDGGNNHPKYKSKESLLEKQQQQEEYENHRTNNKLKEEKENHHHSSNNINHQNNNNLPSVISKIDKGFLSLFQKICSSTRTLFIPEHHQTPTTTNHHRQQQQYRRIPKVLLFGTHTPEEHFTKVNTILDIVKEKHGQEGLHLCGFDYQSVIIPSCEDGGDDENSSIISTSTSTHDRAQVCQQHHHVDDVSNNENNKRKVVDGIDNNIHHTNNGIKHKTDTNLFLDEKKEEMNLLKAYDDDDDDDELTTKDGSIHHNDIIESKPFFHQKQEEHIIHSRIHEETNITHTKEEEEVSTEAEAELSSNCTRTRLIHLPSNTFITKKNRQQFIADGEMYEEIVRLCQEYAQDMMIRYGSLHWTSVCEDESKGNPIRALLHRDIIEQSKTIIEVEEDIHSPSNNDSNNNNTNEDNEGNKEKPSNILLITTGKGKVRAGIFSRLHLLISSIEESTALPYIKEASKRGMKTVILDPNARGDRNGMDTYEKSMEFIFGKGSYLQQQHHHQSTCLFILAHSASGSQLTRYLMDKGHYILQHIRAIAFTDSSHSIQWVKHKSDVQSFLQDPTTLYIRSANENRDYGWEEHLVPGEVCETDEFWKHRFGNVQTLWAGTSDHSLSNWTALEQIWKHFDYFLNRI